MSHPKARSTIQRFGQIQAAVEYDPMDLINFIKKNFVPLNLMMERAGMSEMNLQPDTRRVPPLQAAV